MGESVEEFNLIYLSTRTSIMKSCMEIKSESHDLEELVISSVDMELGKLSEGKLNSELHIFI